MLGISTRNGFLINIDNPEPNTFDIRDIASGLARMCRYGGQIEGWYSVAEHCVKGAMWALPDTKYGLGIAKQFLMHDASEAYIQDINGLVKRRLSDYKKVESRFMYAICQRFKLPWPMGDQIKVIDSRIMTDEIQQLNFANGHLFIQSEALGIKVEGWDYGTAERNFLQLYSDLFGSGAGANGGV